MTTKTTTTTTTTNASPDTEDGLAENHPAVHVFADADAVTRAAAENVIAVGQAAIGERGRVSLALAGGNTPRALYQRLASGENRDRLDWSRVHVFWGDERCVPPDDAASNFRMAREALLDHVPVPAAQVHRLRGEAPPVRAATEYEEELRRHFGGGAARFDLLLLGMGANGHTASLFPGLRAARETERWVVAEFVAEVGQWRLTLTPVALNAAAAVLFLVVGADKAETLREVLEGPRDPDRLPAQLIFPVDGTLNWYVAVG